MSELEASAVVKVLLTTDGSDLAMHAARRALALITPKAEFTALAVVGPPLTTTAAGVGAPLMEPVVSDEMLQQEDVETHANLERLVAELGVNAQRRVEWGDPGATICSVADEGGFDVIVVGSHGSGLMKRVLIGSVSHYVLHHASCAVLVVRDGGKAR